MSDYNVDNMARLLGSDATDQEAEQFAQYLQDRGFTLEIPAGCSGYHVYFEEDGKVRTMTECEWQGALQDCFS